ncbi:MAG: hypothetical protein ACTHM6_16755 [Tepidisphaeraceae bacterium]
MNATENPMLESLKAQVMCYRQLHKLSDLQRSYIRENQTDELLTVLEKRSGLLGEIARLEKDVAPLKRQWAIASVGLAAEQRALAEKMIGEAKALLQSITQADQDDVLILQQRKLNIGKQIQQTTSARAINTRYSAAAYGTPMGGSRLNVKQ